MSLGVINIVRVLKKKSGDAETSFDLNNWEERDMALTNSFEALHGLSYLAFAFMVIS